MIRFKVWTAGIAVAVAVVLQGCGGGGGGDGSGQPASDPAPTGVKPSSVAKIATSFEPSGGTAAPADLFPVHQGDVWINDVLDTSAVADGAPSGALETNTITSLLNGVARMRTTQDVSKFDDSDDYVVQASGVAFGPDFFGFFPNTSNPRVDSFVVYPTQTLPPIGQARSYVRQGDAGEDLDNDGTNEGFRFEFSQVFLGVETRPVAYSPTPKQVWHFRTTFNITVMFSSRDNASRINTAVMDEYLEPGVGVVRNDTLITDADGRSTREVTELKSAKVNGQQVGPVLVDKQLIKVDLPMRVVNYVSAKQWFVGIVSDPGSTYNEQIAIVDANSGAILGYSAAAGPDLSRLVAAPNSDVLYATTTYNEVIRLKFAGSDQAPTLVQTGTVALPVPEGLPQTEKYARYRILSIAVSPADPNRLVLAGFAPFISLTGIPSRLFVYDDMTLASWLDNTGIGFVHLNEAGDKLLAAKYDFNSFTQTLYSFSFNGSKLQQQASLIDNNGSYGRLDGSIDPLLGYYEGDLYTQGNTVSYSDFKVVDRGDTGCPLLPGTNRKVCSEDMNGLRVKSMTDRSKPGFRVTFPDGPYVDFRGRLIPGPSGVVALQYGNSGALVLIKHPQLQ